MGKKEILELLEKIEAKMEVVVKRNLNTVPYTTENGRFIDYKETKPFWWTNGFWGGLLWQLYNYSGKELYKEQALFQEEFLDKNLMSFDGLDHDNGFKWLLTSRINYMLFKDNKSLNRTYLAGANLASRFNPTGNYIRAWNDRLKSDLGKANPVLENRSGIAIIDCMMNLGLLYFMSDELKDPHYKDIAIRHAYKTAENFIREDGSVNHIVNFNPENGDFIESRAGQGYAVGSSWTRGQSWAIYGFVLSYMHTKDEYFLNCAKRVANYFITNLDESYLVKLDFRQPLEDTFEDSTAAAITACGLIEIAKYVGEADRKVYLDKAYKLLEALINKRLNLSLDTDYLLSHCSVAYHNSEQHITIIYGDYFFVEALLKLVNKDLMPW